MRRLLRAAIAAAVIVSCAPTPRVTPAPPETEAALRPIVVEYFELRREANLAGDPSVLLDRHPALGTGEDRERGINVEPWEATSRTRVGRLEYEMERYEPLAYWVHEAGLVEVVVHGLYRSDQRGSGEFKVSLYFEERDSSWKLIRSDEVTLPEYHDQTASPRPD